MNKSSRRQHGEYLTDHLPSRSLNIVRQRLHQLTGIDLPDSKDYLIKSRLKSILRNTDYERASDIVEALNSDPSEELVDAFVDALTTNETYFFRDEHPFEALRKGLIPALKDVKSSGDHFRFLSAACSSGQEPYSIAMLIREHFPELIRRTEIVGMDISTSAISDARDGVYNPAKIKRGLSRKYRRKYFTEVSGGWRVQEDIRSMVTFEQHNLLEPFRLDDSQDVIMLRYILCYMEQGEKQQILDKVLPHLSNEGFLMLGAPEFSSRLSERLELHNESTSPYYTLAR